MLRLFTMHVTHSQADVTFSNKVFPEHRERHIQADGRAFVVLPSENTLHFEMWPYLLLALTVTEDQQHRETQMFVPQSRFHSNYTQPWGSRVNTDVTQSCTPALYIRGREA